MSKPATGLYAPRFVDICFAVMGIGSALSIGWGGSQLIASGTSTVHPAAGIAVLGIVILVGISACLFHHIDQKGWDDYMRQIVSQSALIAMVTLLLSSILRDIVLQEALHSATGAPLINTAVPMACLAWAMGYGFLRWKGTGA